jgi:alpha-glucosidase
MSAESAWWRGAALYQIYLPSFCDGNDDGMGDLPGLLTRLDYVASLGVDAIWISPFFRSPLHDFGYDVAGYTSVDPRFGTLADFDAVISRAHAIGLRVMIDLVWSHSSNEHPWFVESSASADGPKADWYVWSDPADDGGPPNNWLSVFGGAAWSWSVQRRQYYLHHFLPSQPKLNLRHDDVMAAHFANAAFWVERGVDGFRFDAVDFMLHDAALANNPPTLLRPGAMPWNPFRLQRHLHDMCRPETAMLVASIRDFADRYPNLVTMGEISSEEGAFGRVGTLTGETKLHMAYTLRLMKGPFTSVSIRQAVEEATEVNRGGWACWSFSNHDVDRVASRWNPDPGQRPAFVTLALALLLSLPGSICLYQGEELGLPNARLPRDALRDPFGRRFYPAYAGRDASRTPIPWVQGAPNSGFSCAAETWLPVASEHDSLAVDRAEALPQSSLVACRQMLAWRKRHRAVYAGAVEFFDLPSTLVGWRCRRDMDRVVMIFNLSASPVSISADFLPRYDVDPGLTFVIAQKDGRLHLPSFGCSIGLEHRDRQDR